MGTLTARLLKLETKRGGKERLIVMKTGYGHTDEDVDRVLQSHGIRKNSKDVIVLLQTFFEDRDGNILQTDCDPQLLSVH